MDKYEPLSLNKVMFVDYTSILKVMQNHKLYPLWNGKITNYTLSNGIRITHCFEESFKNSIVESDREQVTLLSGALLIYMSHRNKMLDKGIL